jgi:hypothetical protein
MKFSDVSPLAGIATGEGLGNLTQFGALGAVADAIRRDREKDKERERQQQPGVAPTSAGMKVGGKVGSASKRADGCAIRGKTRGKIV